MHKILVSLSVSAVTVASLAAPVYADTASSNVGSIVKISDTCADMGSVANNNVGSIIKIKGNGQCDVNEILKSSAISNNTGSIIKISNVCGDTSGIANNNRGSIIKIDSTGPCKTTEPTTVVVTPQSPATTTPVATTKTTTIAAPTSLPNTGPGDVAFVALAVTLVATAAAHLYQYATAHTRKTL